MYHWKSILNYDQMEWLLEKDNPSVRYFTLTNILDRSENDSEVMETRNEIMTAGVVPRILAKQENDGYWGIPQDFYIKSKYKGTVWQLIILAELMASGNDERVKKACEFMLNNSQDQQSGGFAYFSAKDGGGDHRKVLPCLTANMVWSMIRFGYFEDNRIQQAIKWITSYQRFDDGIKYSPKGWPYDRYEKCWGMHTCHMSVVKSLRALSEIPPEERSPDVKTTIEKGAEYLLLHHIHKKSHDLASIVKNEWLHFGFPHLWQTDALEMLEVLTKLSYKDNRMQETVDLVISKQDELGRWKLENTFNGRLLVNIERKDKPSKWITLKALAALKRFFS